MRGARRALRARPWAEVDCWALDLETSGLDVRRDRILAVGMVPVRDRAVRVGECYATLVRADGPFSDAGVAAHHLLPDQLRDAPSLAEVLAEVDRRLDGAVLVVHAAAIDVGFLRRAHREVGRPWPDPPVVDTLDLLRRQERAGLVHGPAEAAVPVPLAGARAHVGLPPHGAHDAGADALATAELLLLLAHRLGARTVGDLL